MPKQVSKDTLERIALIKKLLTEPDIWINTNILCGSMYKEQDMLDLIASGSCRSHTFKFVNHKHSSGLNIICRSCGKRLLSFNILEYLS